MFIYKITNKLNNKIYIGQTTRTIRERWRCHTNSSKHPEQGHYLHKSMNKYGVNNFEIEQIDTAFSVKELNFKEKFWIKFYNTMNDTCGYNLRSGGSKRSFHSEKTKKKMSDKMMGNKNGKGHVTPIEIVKKRLAEKHGDNITIIENTYKGFTYQCWFLDKEWGKFKAYPQNVLAGYGSAKRGEVARRKNTLKGGLCLLKQRLLKFYKNKITVVEDNYIGMLKKCKFIIDGKEYITYPVNIGRGILPLAYLKTL